MKRPQSLLEKELLDADSGLTVYKERLCNGSEDERLVALSMIPFLVDQYPTSLLLKSHVPPSCCSTILGFFTEKNAKLGKRLELAKTAGVQNEPVDLLLLTESLSSLSSLLLVENFFQSKQEQEILEKICQASIKTCELLVSLGCVSETSLGYLAEWLSFYITLSKLIDAHQKTYLFLAPHLKDTSHILFGLLSSLMSSACFRQLDHLALTLVVHLISLSSILEIDQLKYEAFLSGRHQRILSSFSSIVTSSDACPHISGLLLAIRETLEQELRSCQDSTVASCQNTVIFLLEAFELVWNKFATTEDPLNGTCDVTNDELCSDADEGSCDEFMLDEDLSTAENALSELSVSNRPAKPVVLDPTLSKAIDKNAAILDAIFVLIASGLQKLYIKEEDLDERPPVSRFQQLFETYTRVLEMTNRYHLSPATLTAVSMHIADSPISAEGMFNMFKIALHTESEPFCNVVLKWLRDNIHLIFPDSSALSPEPGVLDFLNTLIGRFEQNPTPLHVSCIFMPKFLLLVVSFSQGHLKKHLDVALYALDVLFDTLGSDHVMSVIKPCPFASEIVVQLEETLAGLKACVSSKKSPSQLAVTLVNLKRFIVWYKASLSSS